MYAAFLALLALAPARAADVQTLQDHLNAFAVVELTGDADLDVNLVLRTKQGQLAALVAEYAAVFDTQRDADPELASAALYLAGLAYQTYAAMLQNMPAPEALDNHAAGLYYEQLGAMLGPLEEKARDRYQAVLAYGAETGQSGTWQEQAEQALDRMPRGPGQKRRKRR